MNTFTAMAIGMALQVLLFALFAKLNPDLYFKHPPSLGFACAQFAALVLFGILELA